MRGLNFISSLLTIGCCLAVGRFSAKPSGDVQLLSMFGVLALVVVGLIGVFIGVRKFATKRFQAFVPATICAVGLASALIAAPVLGGAIRSRRFEANLPRYTEIVRKVEAGELRATDRLERIDLPPGYSDLAVTMLGKTNTTGDIVLEFIIGGGFPVKHSGYLYVSSGKPESDPVLLRRWPHRRKLSDNWSAIAD